MAKQVTIAFNNPLDESNINHIEVWKKIGVGGTYSKFGANVPFVAGVAPYSIVDQSADIIDGADVHYEVRNYNATGQYAMASASIVIALPVEAMAADFSGYTRLNTTNITITDFVEFQTTGEAPFMLRTAATGTSATGARFSGKALKALTDLDYRWTVTKSDLSPVLYKNELLNPQDSSVYNPYTDTIGCEAAFYLREAGDYIVTCEIRGARTDGQVIKQTFSKTYTVAESSSTHKWYDPTGGLNTNDGLDPWGFALTAASYDNATYTLTKTGAFTSLVMDTEYPQNSSNFIYLTGGTGINVGLYEIASKTSNDVIVLKKSAGATAIDVTSSNGALQTFAGLDTSSDNATIAHLKGGNTYALTDSISPRAVGFAASLLPKGVFQYGGAVVLTNGGLPVGESLVYPQAGSSDIWATQFTLDGDITIDGTASWSTCNGALGSSNTFKSIVSFIGTSNINSNTSIASSIEVITATNNISFVTWGESIDNKANFINNYTLAAGSAAGDAFVTVNEAITGTTEAAGSITIGGTVYEYSSITGTTFNLATSVTLNATYPTNEPAVVKEKKALSLFTRMETGDWEMHVCPTWTNDCAHRFRDHYAYLNGSTDHLAVHHSSATGSDNANMVLNLNNGTAGSSRLSTVIVGGEWSDTTYGTDGSGTLNPYDDEFFENIFAYNVNASVKEQFTAYSSTKNFFAKKVDVVITSQATASHAFKLATWGTGTLDPTLFSLTLEDCRISEGKAFSNTQGINFEAYNVDCVDNGAGDATYGNFEIDTTSQPVGNVTYVDECNLYTPSYTGKAFELNGVDVPVATFNAGVSGTNYNTDPAWTDFPPVTSYTLTLGDPNRIASYTAPAINSTDDFNLEFDVMIRTGTPSIPFTKFLRYSANSTTELRVNAAATDLQFKTFSTTVVFTVPAFVYDTWVNVRFKRVSGALSVSIDGGAYSATQPFANSILYDEISQVSTDVISMKNLKIENVTTSTLTQYNLNSGELVSEAADVGTGTITYTNPLWT